MRIQSLSANQTVVELSSGCQVFFSYETPVAAKFDGVSYKTDRKYSTTTTRHVNAWLGNDNTNAVVKPQSWFDNLASN